MKTKRIDAIMSYINEDDCLIDVGCDHAYVCILAALKGSKNILGIDIHKMALESARKNVEQNHLESVINLLVGDGLSLIDPTPYNTLVIAGMGRSTIEHILKNKKKLETINKIILQSNNELNLIRLFMQKLGYKLEDEKVVFENKHYYTIMKYIKGEEVLTEDIIEFGIKNEKYQEYYEFLFQNYQNIIKKIPKTDTNYQKIEYKISLLKKYLN